MEAITSIKCLLRLLMKHAQMSGAILHLLFTKPLRFSNILGMSCIKRFLEDTLKHLNQAEVKNLPLKAVCFVPQLLVRWPYILLQYVLINLGIHFSIDDSKPVQTLYLFVFFLTNSPWVLSVHRIFCTVEQWNIQVLFCKFAGAIFSYPILINKAFRDPTWPVGHKICDSNHTRIKSPTWGRQK